MNRNSLQCKHCKKLFNNQDRKPITIVCGDTLCEQCYDASLLDNGKQIKCPVDGNIYQLIGEKIYGKVIKLKALIKPKFFVYCDLHSLEPADYYYKVDDKLICKKCLAKAGQDSIQFHFMGGVKLENLGDELLFRLDAFLEPFQLIQRQISDLKNRKVCLPAKRMMEIVHESQALFEMNDWETDFISYFGFKSESMKSNKDQPRQLDQAKQEKEKVKQQPEENNGLSEKQKQELIFQFETELKEVQDRSEKVAYQKDYEIKSLKQQLQQSINKVSQQKDIDITKLQQDLQNSQSLISQLKEECDMLQDSLNSQKNENKDFPIEMKDELEKRVEDLEKIKQIMDEALEHKDMTNRRLKEQLDQLQNQRLIDQQNYVQNQSKVKEPVYNTEEIVKLTQQLEKKDAIIMNIQCENDLLREELKENEDQRNDQRPNDTNQDQKVRQLYERIEGLDNALHEKNAQIKSLLREKLQVELEQQDEIKKLRKEVDMLQSELDLFYENLDNKDK